MLSLGSVAMERGGGAKAELSQNHRETLQVQSYLGSRGWNHVTGKGRTCSVSWKLRISHVTS